MLFDLMACTTEKLNCDCIIWLVMHLIPEGRNVTMKLHTYLNYGGNCEQAFRFYEQHLGGKITMMMTHGEQPGLNSVPPGWQTAILFARMSIGETKLMGSDVPPERFQPMRSVYLSLSVTSTDEAQRIHALISDGGQIFMPMQETFFAFRFSMLRDKFGTSWMIIHERPMTHQA
jgi:PhnB protein